MAAKRIWSCGWLSNWWVSEESKHWAENVLDQSQDEGDLPYANIFESELGNDDGSKP
jgi:hypothetical protein